MNFVTTVFKKYINKNEAKENQQSANKEQKIAQSANSTSREPMMEETRDVFSESLTEKQAAETPNEYDEYFQDAETNPVIKIISPEMTLPATDLQDKAPGPTVSTHGLPNNIPGNDGRQRNETQVEIENSKNAVFSETSKKKENPMPISHGANPIEPDSLNHSMVDSLELVDSQDEYLVHELTDSMEILQCDNRVSLLKPTLGEQDDEEYESLSPTANNDSIDNVNSLERQISSHTKSTPTVTDNNVQTIVEPDRASSQYVEEGTFNTSPIIKKSNTSNNIFAQTKPVSLNDILCDSPVREPSLSILDEVDSRSNSDSNTNNFRDTLTSSTVKEFIEPKSALEVLIQSANQTFAINEPCLANISKPFPLRNSINTPTTIKLEAPTTEDIKILDATPKPLEDIPHEVVDVINTPADEKEVNDTNSIVTSSTVPGIQEVENQPKKESKVGKLNEKSIKPENFQIFKPQHNESIQSDSKCKNADISDELPANNKDNNGELQKLETHIEKTQTKINLDDKTTVVVRELVADSSNREKELNGSEMRTEEKHESVAKEISNSKSTPIEEEQHGVAPKVTQDLVSEQRANHTEINSMSGCNRDIGVEDGRQSDNPEDDLKLGAEEICNESRGVSKICQQQPSTPERKTCENQEPDVSKIIKLAPVLGEANQDELLVNNYTEKALGQHRITFDRQDTQEFEKLEQQLNKNNFDNSVADNNGTSNESSNLAEGKINEPQIQNSKSVTQKENEDVIFLKNESLREECINTLKEQERVGEIEIQGITEFQNPEGQSNDHLECSFAPRSEGISTVENNDSKGESMDTEIVSEQINNRDSQILSSKPTEGVLEHNSTATDAFKSLEKQFSENIESDSTLNESEVLQTEKRQLILTDNGKIGHTITSSNIEENIDQYCQGTLERQDTKDFEKLEGQCEENSPSDSGSSKPFGEGEAGNNIVKDVPPAEMHNKESNMFGNLDIDHSECVKGTIEAILDQLVNESSASKEEKKEPETNNNKEQDIESENNKIFYRQDTREFEVIEKQCTEDGEVSSALKGQNSEIYGICHKTEDTLNCEIDEHKNLKPISKNQIESENIQHSATNKVTNPQTERERNQIEVLKSGLVDGGKIAFDRQDTKEFENLEKQCKEAVLSDLNARSTINEMDVETKDSNIILETNQIKIKSNKVEATYYEAVGQERNTDEANVTLSKSKNNFNRPITEDLADTHTNIEQENENASMLETEHTRCKLPVQVSSQAVEKSFGEKTSRTHKPNDCTSSGENNQNVTNIVPNSDFPKNGNEETTAHAIPTEHEPLFEINMDGKINQPLQYNDMPEAQSENQQHIENKVFDSLENSAKQANLLRNNEDLKNKVDLLQQELDSIRKMNSRKDRIIQTSKLDKQLDRNVISKYKDLLKEYEKRIVQQSKVLETLKMDSERNVRNFTNTEMAFSDIFEKYEKTKFVIAMYGKNEDILLANIQNAEEQLSQVETKCLSMKQQSVEQIRRAREEVEQERRKYKQEVTKLQAQVKRLEIKASSLEVALKQKTDECQALAALCDDITGRNST